MLEASDRLEAVRCSHHAYFLGLADRSNQAFADGAEEDRFRAQIRNDYENVCDALTDFIQGGRAEEAQRMVPC